MLRGDFGGLTKAGAEGRAVIAGLSGARSAPDASVGKYSPSQPRVTAGNGRASGQWTSDGADCAVTGPADGPRARLITAQDIALQNPRFRPPRAHGGPTFCNFATVAVLKALGADLTGFVGAGGRPLLADQVAKNLAAMAKAGSIETVDAKKAQQIANGGGVVVVAYDNRSGNGHLATIRPEAVDGDPSLGGRGPILTNIGRQVGVRRFSRIFKASAEVRFYVIK